MPLTARSWFAMLLFALVALGGLWLRPLMPVDETRYVAVAWEMFQSGDFFVPTRNFELYTDKPPLLFWGINLLWAIFGVSEFAARIVGPAFALLAIGLTARLARRLWPEAPAMPGRAAWALAGTAVFVFFGGLTTFDAALTVAVLLGMLSLVGVARGGGLRSWAGFGAALALGTLAKGPVIFLHLLPAALLLPLWGRDLAPGGTRIAARRIGAGLALAIGVGLAIVSLWLVPAILQGGEAYREAILWEQSAGRITESFAHSRPFYWFLVTLPLLLFPWAWMPPLWRQAARARWSEPGLRLCLVWSLSALLLFSLIDGKQLHYLVPELPAVALIVARLLPESGGRGVWLAALPVALVGAAFALAGLGVIDTGSVTALLSPKVTLLTVGLGLVAVGGMALGAPLLRGGAILSLGLMLCLGLTMRFTDAYAAYDAREIGRILAGHAGEGVAFGGAARYHAEFNFAARMTEPVALLNDLDAVRAWQAEHPHGVFVSRLERFSLPEKPAQVVNFRDRAYGIYPSAGSVGKEPQS